MTRWEYKRVSIPDGEVGESKLAELGGDGWELVAVYQYADAEGWFKREVADELRRRA